jgi:hypothetical protein
LPDSLKGALHPLVGNFQPWRAGSRYLLWHWHPEVHYLLKTSKLALFTVFMVYNSGTVVLSGAALLY